MTRIIGHSKDNVHGPHLFDAAGKMIVSTGARRTAVVDAPLTAAVTADVTHAQSNTTLSDVTGLVIPITASATEIWFFKAWLSELAASAAVDVKYGWTFPSGATMKWGPVGGVTGAVGGFQHAVVGTTPTAGLWVQTDTVPFGTFVGLSGRAIAGWIFGGGTAGNVQLQFAQNTSTASDLTVQKGSLLEYRRLVA